MSKITKNEGATTPIKFTVVDNQGAAITLTTEAFELKVASTEDATVADIFTSTATITDAANGKISFPITGTTAEGTYYYNIEITNTASQIDTLARGSYEVCPRIGS